MTAATPGAAAAATMTAIAQDEYGTAPEAVPRLAEIARPAIADDEILVRVRAASVDRGTWHLMAGLPYPMRLAGFGLRRAKAPNPGRSLAGTVESAGQRSPGIGPAFIGQRIPLHDLERAEGVAAKGDEARATPFLGPALPADGVAAVTVR